MGAALIMLPRVPSFWHSSSPPRRFLARGCALSCSDGDLEHDQNLPARCHQPRLGTITLDIAAALPALVLCQLPGDFSGREALPPPEAQNMNGPWARQGAGGSRELVPL